MARNINYNVEVDAFVFRNPLFYNMNRNNIDYYSSNDYYDRKLQKSTGSYVGFGISVVLGAILILLTVIFGK